MEFTFLGLKPFINLLKKSKLLKWNRPKILNRVGMN